MLMSVKNERSIKFNLGIGFKREAVLRHQFGRLLRGGLSPVGRADFCPVEGGSDELSGVLGGRSNAASRFSSSAMRASAASNCPTNGSSDRISSSFAAAVNLLRSTSGVTGSLNRVARDHVNHDRAARQPPTSRRPS